MDEILYIRLIDGTIIPYDKFEGEIPSDAKVGELYKLLQVGDYAKIEFGNGDKNRSSIIYS